MRRSTDTTGYPSPLVPPVALLVTVMCVEEMLVEDAKADEAKTLQAPQITQKAQRLQRDSDVAELLYDQRKVYQGLPVRRNVRNSIY
jgi:hypothetical protein